MKKISSLCCLLILVGYVLSYPLFAATKPYGLICNGFARPEQTVITHPVPQFGWILPAEEDNGVQTAYHLLVASSIEKLDHDLGDLWDTGKVHSRQSQHVIYKGIPLEPQKTYFWKVAYWNSRGEKSGYSDPQQFNMGVFGQVRDWPGQSRWVNIRTKSGDFWTFEDRNPIVYHPIYAQKTRRMVNGSWFIDFGRSAFAYPEITLDWDTDEPDQEMTILVRLGEKAIGDSIDQKPGGGVLCKEYPLTIRSGRQTYSLSIPRFVSHYPHSQVMPDHMPEVLPFRYAEIVCDRSPISLVSAQQWALHTVFDQTLSSFHSSCGLLDSIYDLCRYSIIANTFNGDYAASQRERMMYEADCYIHQMGHYAVDREYSVARYSLKNMIYHATWPTEWIPHVIMMAWADYLHTGNSDILREYYSELKPKTLSALQTEKGLISTRTGLQNRAFFESIHFNGKELKDIVDWPHGSMSIERKGGETDEYDFQDYNTVVNAFHYHALVLMGQIAEAIGEKKDLVFYTRQAQNVKKLFNDHFFDQSQGIYVDGLGSTHASLHANMFSLAFGLVPDQQKKSVLAYIQTKGMACGVYGANYLLEALFDAGADGYALSLLTDTTDRSWYNMIRIGSTMTTEAWDNKYKNNNGWSHAWSSSPAHIIPRKIMGIEPLVPGFETIRIQPRPASLEHAAMQLPTIRGTVKADFVNEPGRFVLSVTIPGNTQAKVYLPVMGSVTGLFINGKQVKHRHVNNGYVYTGIVGSGEHRFELICKE